MQQLFSFIFTRKTIDFIDSNRPAQQIVAGNAYWTPPSSPGAPDAAFLNSALGSRAARLGLRLAFAQRAATAARACSDVRAFAAPVPALPPSRPRDWAALFIFSLFVSAIGANQFAANLAPVVAGVCATTAGTGIVVAVFDCLGHVVVLHIFRPSARVTGPRSTTHTIRNRLRICKKYFHLFSHLQNH
jgi:hypothetical protein